MTNVGLAVLHHAETIGEIPVHFRARSGGGKAPLPRGGYGRGQHAVAVLGTVSDRKNRAGLPRGSGAEMSRTPVSICIDGVAALGKHVDGPWCAIKRVRNPTVREGLRDKGVLHSDGVR